MGNNTWQTPKWLYGSLNEEFHFRTDPCTSEDNPLKTELFYTEVEDGLRLPWRYPVFINPPYGHGINKFTGKQEYLLEKWVGEASYRIRNDENATNIVMLIPNVTPKFWFDFIWDSVNHKPYPEVTIRYEWLDHDKNEWKPLKRVKFIDPLSKKIIQTPRFDSVIVIFTRC